MRRVPLSTYRLQIRPSFDLFSAAEVTDYLRDLGVDWAYLSPLLKATEGSDHGYDVVDPSLVDPARGGSDGLDRFVQAAREAGLGILVDIVPNHMGISQPAQNPWWWDVLTHGQDSRYAEAFDIDWEAGDGRVRVPILGAALPEIIAAGELMVDAEATDLAPDGVIRYYDHVLPLAPGSLDGVEHWDLLRVLERQHWAPIYWRDEASSLNYRRFFAVSTLAGVRVEVPRVFDEAHAEVLRWVNAGMVDGLRIDHPDGLVDPGAYLERLAAATGGVYVLVEKILEHAATPHPEQLPAWWATDGTTGYDAMAEVDRVLTDPGGEAELDALDLALREETGVPAANSYADVIHGTKLMIAETIQESEVRRLVRILTDPEVGGAQEALAELLANFPVYRSYLPAGREHLDAATAEALRRRPDLAGAIDRVVPQLADPATEVARRFQQTTGPVMAKGVEDTAFYRYTRLGSLTEVGGDPSVFALPVEGFHAAQERRQAAWPDAMTSRSTHDTKRGEDVRARLAVLAEIPQRWAAVLAQFRAIASTGHGPFDSLLFQAIVGAWPVSADRLHAYAEKAAREAAEATGWWDPVPEFEERMHAAIDTVFTPVLGGMIGDFVDEIRMPGWSNGLAAKLLQLAGPGVPDVYQGSELWETSLVDPDNRRQIDFDEHHLLLADVDKEFHAGRVPKVDESGAAKMLVVSRALRLRRDRPELFTRYTPATTAGAASAHAIAFDRGGALAVATRLPVGLAAQGGWGDTVLLRRRGAAVDVLTGRRFDAAELPLADLLRDLPVALLVAE